MQGPGAATPWQDSGVIVERIGAYVADPGAGAFEELALEAFAFQYERIEAYRRLCRRLGAVPGEVATWREVPAVPALAFKSMELAAAAAIETFRSSGTTGRSPSVHRHPYPELYRRVIDATFPPACLGSLRRPPMLSLIPSREQAPDSSLSFMADHLLATQGAEDSAVAIGPRGVDARRARAFLAARQRDQRPTVLLATSFALADLLDALERLDLRFRLPSGSVAFETGGYKGRHRELGRAAVLERLHVFLDLPADRVVREYGMTELTSHFYTRALEGGDPGLFVPPPWVRVRVLDPETLAEAPPGKMGLIAVFDLANVGSALHLLTEDLGIAEADGFRLAGRAAGAELRGCSLTVEELRTAP